MRLALIVGAAATAMMLSPSAGAQEEPDGREVYLSSCAACHQASGAGVPGSFPPLVDNPNVQDTEYLRTVILEGKSGPIDVNGVTYDAQMPAVTLTDAEVDAVIAYTQAGVFTAADTAPVGEGGVEAGNRLFLGQDGLDNGGLACHACHSAGSHGNLGGPTLGPDLSDLAQRYGSTEAIAAALANPPSATMQPVFDGKPLTDQERADLAAYLGSLSAPTKTPVDLMLIIGLAGAAALFGVMHLLSKRNRISYLQQLRSGS
jgi:mono/diheme cytochrome c family protein